ncbi:MAG: ATP-binding protein [Gammaproteobacteria bacterium HGW-Gammaproteobacteria-4]|jgi:thymidylate kinase|nr:MAG: ATP-binding protein [Gammaproteobacteria bacterium HGW-Gammaproteobacteria-4]
MASERAVLGPLIAVIGCDGSGKSTVSAEVLAWASRFGPAAAAHLGKQAGTVGRAVERWPLVGAWLGRVIKRKTDSTRAQRDKKAPGLLTALVLTVFSLRAARRFRRMMALRRQGLIIVTDRYPQLDVPGSYDGTGLSVTASGSAIVRWLARRERANHERMTSHRPDLVLRLNVDLDTACARKPDHRRELLAEKIAATPLLKFNGAPIVDIDGTQPLDEVLAAARAAVTKALRAKGYAAPAA